MGRYVLCLITLCVLKPHDLHLTTVSIYEMSIVDLQSKARARMHAQTTAAVF